MDVSKLLLSIQDIQDVIQKELAQDNIRSIFCMASFRFPDIRASVFDGRYPETWSLPGEAVKADPHSAHQTSPENT